MLRQQGVCKLGTKDVCDIDNVRINCGEASEFNFGRRKRSTGTVSGKLLLAIKFDIKVAEKAVKTINCARFCGNIELNSDRCKKICRERYTAETLGNIEKVSQTLKNLFKTNVKIATVTAPPVYAATRGMTSGSKGWSARRKIERPQVRPPVTSPPKTQVSAPAGLVGIHVI